MRVLLAVCVLVSGLGGCKAARPTALEVCAKLVESGVAGGCKAEAPGGINVAAAEKAVFDLPSVPGETGQVLRFEKSSDYEATTKAYDAMAVLAGRHRYGSEKALIFVQLNSQASSEIGAKADAVVKGL